MEHIEVNAKLVAILRDNNEYLERRLAAAEALGNTSLRSAREALVSVIDDTLEDLALQATAIKALGKSMNLK